MLYPCQSLKAKVVSLHGLNVVAASVAPVAVHDKCDVLRNGALTEGSNEELAQTLNAPYYRWRHEKPFPKLGKVERGGHVAGELSGARWSW